MRQKQAKSTLKESVKSLIQTSASLILYKALLAEPQVYKDIAKVGKRLSWVLNFNVSKVGNDGKRIQKCVLFLRGLKEHAEKASA